ncbi:uncharacterized protein LOC141904320 [Tubulanus polymorphus]|uniref:uncharacterized protein LOC141904320 n=1 Tax=Tubulanus polymorphus TaxID=672921 RepID=UPI003DA20451
MTQTEATITKRKVASRTAAVFDPLGLVAPVTITLKVFINKLWQSSIEWDQELDESELKEWSIIHNNLNQTHQIEFPRWLGFDNESPIKLMVFCDAAPNSAVGCVIYGKQGNKIRLIGSKNKVISKAKAGWTVPKLELEGMVMAAKYADSIRRIYEKEYAGIDNRYFTDSAVALYWLKSEKELKVFVKNRVTAIKQLCNVHEWKHVPSKLNPADILSRAATYDELMRSMWITGPEWMENQDEPPPDDQPDTSVILVASLEIENEFQTRTGQAEITGIDQIIQVQDFTDYRRLLRVTALVKRAFRKGLKSKNIISADDIREAEVIWIQSVQLKEYPEVHSYFTHKTSKCPTIVRQLGVYRNAKGTLRCAGRLRNAEITQARKEPILIPNQSYLASLIVRDAHESVFATAQE